MEQETARREARYVVSQFLAISLLVAVAVTVPFALVSFWNDIGAAADTVYSSNSQDASVTDQRLVLDISELDEVAGTVTMFATAARVCTPTCSTSDQLVIRSVNVDAEDLAVPVEARLTFEAMASSTSREVVLPLYGNYLHYPFDRWSLFLTVVLESAAEGDVAAPEDDVTVTQVTVTSRLPRMDMHPHPDADDIGLGSGNASVALEFQRPIHLQLVTVWMVLAISAIAACVVFLTPVDALIASAAGLVLTVWGIRGILRRTLVPATSAVDVALSIVALCVLLATLVRILWLFEDRSRRRVFRWLPGSSPSDSGTPVDPPDPPPSDFRPGGTRAPSCIGSGEGFDGQA